MIFELASLVSHTGFTVLTKKEICPRGETQLWTFVHTQKYSWQTEVIELKEERKLPDHRQAQTLLSLLPAPPVMELSKGLQASYWHLFLFFLHRNENCEQCKLSTSDLPQHKNVERLVCHRGTRRVDTILFSGFELLWLTLLAGWLTVWLADDATETGFKCNMFAKRNSLTFQEILRSVPLSCPLIKATASSWIA